MSSPHLVQWSTINKASDMTKAGKCIVLTICFSILAGSATWRCVSADDRPKPGITQPFKTVSLFLCCVLYVALPLVINMLFCEAASCYRALPENLSCIQGSRLMSFNADTDFALLFEPAQQQKKLQAWSQVTLIGWARSIPSLLMWTWTPSFLKRKLTKAGLVWIMDVSVF